jgi:tRNA-modifying protein YgfZ
VIGTQAIHLGTPALLEFRGPDAVRFLNGQVTQDVRRVAGGKISLPSCVTDAKGKLQFRVTITENDEGALWIAGPAEWTGNLEARLTRYLIADDVETIDLTGIRILIHFLGAAPDAPEGTLVRLANRFGIDGTDWWCPAAQEFPSDISWSQAEAVEALRIANGVPAWGKELLEGMLPPEALLEETDISYNKGCYIGQEVISRIKSAGKINRRLTRFVVAADLQCVAGPLEKGAGEITSVSPMADGAFRDALGYVKRGATESCFKTENGTRFTVRVA